MSDASVVPGTSPVPPEGSLQEQINQLKANGIATTFHADIPVSVKTPIIGMPVCPSATEPTVGITSCGLAAAIGTQLAAQCLGLITAINEVRSTVTGLLTKVYTIQSSGILILTEEQWDAITLSSGGLAEGETYFLDAVGVLAQLPPGTPGDWSSQVGTALNARTLLLSTPSVPIQVA